MIKNTLCTLLHRVIKSSLTASIRGQKVSSSQLLIIQMHLIKNSRDCVGLLVWSIQVCVLAQCQGGKTSEMILEKQLLLPINLGRVRRPFPVVLLPPFVWETWVQVPCMKGTTSNKGP